MTLSRPSARRSLPVTLRQVPEPVRLHAARHAARDGDGDALVLAALFPSARVYYVCSSAAPLLAEWERRAA